VKHCLTIFVLAFLVPRFVRASDWTMFSGNPQHTGEASAERRLSKRSVPKLRLHWKIHLDNATKELMSLTVPIAVTDINNSSGTKDYLIVAGSDDNVFALDANSGRVLWKRHFHVTATPKQAAEWLCPNALTATPVIDRGKRLIYALASDGQLYALNLITGEDAQPPRQMTPAFAKTWSLTLVDGVLYTATSQACNGIRSAIYAMTADNGAPQEFLAMRTYGAGIWGRAGVSLDSDRTVFAETGDGGFDPKNGQYPNTVLAVDGKTLQLKDYFTPGNHAYIFKKDLDMGNMTPVVFRYGSKELVAASGKEGVIYLLDGKCLGGADHSTPLFKSDLLANTGGSYFGHGFWGALSTRADDKGVRWLYAPAWGPATEQTKFQFTYGRAPSGSVMAFQVTGPESKPVLIPVWQSTDMAVPEPAVIANGVVFALSNGENVTQNDADGRLLKSEFRASHPAGYAILYALDGDTGAVLFSSRDAISSFTHFSGLAVAGGQVFATTWDNTVYAFSTR
jgi:outer membrane protein assembly factor BamB